MPTEQQHEDVQQERARFARRLKRTAAGRFVFLDESGVRVGMKRTHGRSAPGCRIVDHASAGRWETHTVTAAIRVGGVAAAMVTKKAINAITFLGFIEEFLCPTLLPGDVVVMDNLAVHKVRGVEQAIRAVGARLLYLPPYSPDLNPIEMAWSKMKTLLRSKSPPTFRRLVNAIGKALQAISASDCRGYFKTARKAATATHDSAVAVSLRDNGRCTRPQPAADSIAGGGLNLGASGVAAHRASNGLRTPHAPRCKTCM